MKTRWLLNYGLYISIGVMIMITDSANVYSINGQLRVHPTNPRYFTDDSGDVIYLTGSHMWNNLVDMGEDDPPQPFDFPGYLDFLQRYGHNFIRLWAWDSVTWNTQANGSVLGKDLIHNVAPQSWARTGPGNALDGKPKFDLTRFNPDYFGRLRERVASAGERGIYVSVMLFEGWGPHLLMVTLFSICYWRSHETI